MSIGISIVKELIAMHNGSIDVASEEGKGSTFTIRLPVAGALDFEMGMDRSAGAGTFSEDIGAARIN